MKLSDLRLVYRYGMKRIINGVKVKKIDITMLIGFENRSILVNSSLLAVFIITNTNDYWLFRFKRYYLLFIYQA